MSGQARLVDKKMERSFYGLNIDRLGLVSTEFAASVNLSKHHAQGDLATAWRAIPADLPVSAKVTGIKVCNAILGRMRLKFLFASVFRIPCP